MDVVFSWGFLEKAKETKETAKETANRVGERVALELY